MKINDNDIHVLPQISNLFQKLWNAPGARGALYLTTNAALLELASRLRDRDQQFSSEWMHIALAPCVAMITAGFRRMQPNSTTLSNNRSGSSRLSQFAKGAVLGAGAITASLAVARARGWLSGTSWGWEQHTAKTLASSIALIAAGHLAVTFNEETVFRGYGYETLSQAMPPIAAGGIVTLLFALAHRLEPQILIGEIALGIPLIMLRVRTNDIAMSMGYHWAWNVVQTAVFAPVDAAPSLLPIELHGPYLWIGRPGSPEPGVLMIIVNGIVASALGLTHVLGKRYTTGE